MKHIILLFNLIITFSIYSQNIDYNKYESSKNEDLSYKVYLDIQNSDSEQPVYKENLQNRLIITSNSGYPISSESKYFFADKGEGNYNYVYLKETGEVAVVSSDKLLELKRSEKVKTGEWNYYYSGKLKEKVTYAAGIREGPTYLYNDNGEVSDTLYYYNDFIDEMLNLDKMSHYMEYLRNEKYYSKYSSKFSNGEWEETNFMDNQLYVGKKNRNNRRIGIWKVYTTYQNEKQLIQTLNYSNGVRQGKLISYYESGEISCIVNFDNGITNEEVIYYYPNGKVKGISNYNKNIKVGKQISVSEDGEVFYGRGSEHITRRIKVTDPAILLRIKNFKKPNTIEDLMSIKNEEVKNSITVNKPNEEVKNITTTNKTPESEDDTVYNSMGLDKHPSFIGGNGDLDSYVNENFNNKNLSGKIFVSFVVEKDGNLSSIKVVRDLGEGSGEEVLRVLNLCKNCWSPAEIKDKKVRCSYSLPISINK